LVTGLIVGALVAISGCSKKQNSACITPETEAELVKKAYDQGIINKTIESKVKFSVISIEEVVEESKSSPNSKAGQDVVCKGRGKLEYSESIRKEYEGIQKAVKDSFPFALNYFASELSSTKLIIYKLKKNQLTKGIIVDGEWMQDQLDEGSGDPKAQPLSEIALEVIENKDKILADLKDISQILEFKNFILDKQSSDLAKPGKPVMDFIVKNKVPVLRCIYDTDTKLSDVFFNCRIAGERAAMNIHLRYENIDQVIGEVFDKKSLPLYFQVRDENIEVLISKAQYVTYVGKSFETFKVAFFKDLEHLRD
jgi:hypothetical protein